MKHLKTVLVVTLFALVLQASTRKVCILHEQKILPSITDTIGQRIDVQLENTGVININEVIGEIAESNMKIAAETNEEIAAETSEKIAAETSENIADEASEEIVTEASEEITAESVEEIVAETSEEIGDKTADVLILNEQTTEPGDITVLSNRKRREASQLTNDCILEAISSFEDQNDLLQKMCAMTKEHSSLFVITIHNTTVKSDLSFATLCTDGPQGLLTWISWQDFIEKIQPLLNIAKVPEMVMRNSTIGAPGKSGSTVDSFSEVLIEMLPIDYKLLNMKPSTWNNNTFIKPILLGSHELKNFNHTDQHIEGDIMYSFQIETNTTFLSNYPIKGLPVEISDASNMIQHFIVGSINKYTFNDIFSVERLVPAFKNEIVTLKGTYGLHEYDIEGTIVSNFGINADGNTIEEFQTIRARVITLGAYDIKETYHLEDITVTSTENNESEELPVPIPIIRPDQPIYPGFIKVFYVACVVFFGTLAIVAVDVVRKLGKDRRDRLHGIRREMRAPLI